MMYPYLKSPSLPQGISEKSYWRRIDLTLECENHAFQGMRSLLCGANVLDVLHQNNMSPPTSFADITGGVHIAHDPRCEESRKLMAVTLALML